MMLKPLYILIAPYYYS